MLIIHSIAAQHGNRLEVNTNYLMSTRRLLLKLARDLREHGRVATGSRRCPWSQLEEKCSPLLSRGPVSCLDRMTGGPGFPSVFTRWSPARCWCGGSTFWWSVFHITLSLSEIPKRIQTMVYSMTMKIRVQRMGCASAVQVLSAGCCRLVFHITLSLSEIPSKPKQWFVLWLWKLEYRVWWVKKKAHHMRIRRSVSGFDLRVYFANQARV